MIDTSAMPYLADIPRHQAKLRPNDIAISFESEITSFAELDRRTNRIANGLIAMGISPDNRVAYLGKNMGVYYEILLGVSKARAALAAMNYRLAAPELEFVLADSQAKILFVAQEFYELTDAVAPQCPDLEHIIAIDGAHADWDAFTNWRDAQDDCDPMLKSHMDDDVVQLYTSGTTGLPKGVQITNRNYYSFFSQAAPLVWAKYGADETVLNAMPLFHVAGVNVGLLSLIQGSKLVVLREIHTVTILDLIEKEGINHTFLVPAVILMLTQVPGVKSRDFSSLSIITYGASPITEGLLTHAMDLFGCRFTQVYGLTETAGAGTYMPPEDHAPDRGKLRSCGIPYPEIEIKCLDNNGNPVAQGMVGEVVIKSDTVMKGYWQRPQATADAIRNGWFYTGDAGYFDGEGYLYIHDRVKDMIISGGENIYPAEVENALFSHPDIADVAVVGVPDDVWGEAVKAIIVPNPGCAPLERDIIAFAKTKIAGYKCPKSVDIHAEPLPRNPSGKVLRRHLREPYWKGQGRNVS